MMSLTVRVLQVVMI